MLITIVQAEIELAIKNYINTQVNLKEGQEISIDLRATRGAEGATAIIDIYYPETRAATEAANTAAQDAKKDQANQPAPAQQPRTLNVRRAEEPKEDASQEEDKPEETPAQPEPEKKEETPAPKADKDSSKGKQEAGGDKPASTGKSLFAGLTRPNNG